MTPNILVSREFGLSMSGLCTHEKFVLKLKGCCLCWRLLPKTWKSTLEDLAVCGRKERISQIHTKKEEGNKLFLVALTSLRNKISEILYFTRNLRQRRTRRERMYCQPADNVCFVYFFLFCAHPRRSDGTCRLAAVVSSLFGAFVARLFPFQENFACLRR